MPDCLPTCQLVYVPTSSCVPIFLLAHLSAYICTYPPMSLYVSTYLLCFYLPTYLPTYLSTYLPTYLPAYLPTYLPTYLYLPTALFVCLPAYLLACLSTYPTYLPTYTYLPIYQHTYVTSFHLSMSMSVRIVSTCPMPTSAISPTPWTL